ncbi:MAG: cysteine desulfurase [Rhodospirillales bacterium]|nr:cysteine desulfurase [Rhodospirillales bacterium]
MTSTVYLDFNASAPIRPGVAEAMTAAAGRGNPSSVHAAGRAARALMEDSREIVAALIGAKPSEVVFTSGGTESNHIALNGTGRKRILLTAAEHPSVRNAGLRGHVDRGFVAVDANGVINPGALEAALCEDDTPALVTVMLANNETGAISPMAEVVALAHAHGAIVHCDAVQAVGKIPVDVESLGVDLLSISAHKIGGPQGVGALFVRDGVRLRPSVRGGGQEKGLRPGTENLPGIAGFSVAAGMAKRDLTSHMTIAALRDRMEADIGAHAPEAVFFAKGCERLPNTSCFALPGVSAETQVMALDLEGVMISGGAACSSGKVAPSHVLKAIGADDDTASSAIRVSLGWSSDAAGIERFVSAWCGLRDRLRKNGKVTATAA